MLIGSAMRPVVDRAGLDARYNYLLSFTPLSAQPAESNSDSPPDLFTALQQQLGLRLESAKGPVEVIVIDRAEKPSEN